MSLVFLLAQAIAFTPAETNLAFTLHQSPTPEKHLVETMAGGLAVFDYNGDGRPDLFFTNGAALPARDKRDQRYWNRLFRNDGNWQFTDVTEQAGLSGQGYDVGAAAADFDNDGHIDLFVAGVYRNTLYRNLGDGRFADVTARSTIKSNEWSVAAGWFDFDNDGLLDLFVTNYGRIDLAAPRFCGDVARKLRVYCHPRYYDPRPNQLYRNRGDGIFEDVSQAAGLSRALGRGMSIAFADYDLDGWMDVFVANDNLPNFLFRNRGKGVFEESALLAGVALLDHGKPVASMGSDFSDFNNDGLPDLVVTALSGETFPLFRNQGRGAFQDAGYASQLARLSNPFAGWGVGFVDFDNDGFKDIFTANSHVNDIVEKFEKATYRQPNTVFRNMADGRFIWEAKSGLDGAVKAHRGAVFADFDQDGRLDAAVTALSEPVELWRNTSPASHHWVAVSLIGTRSNRDGIGARVTIGKQLGIRSTSVSYASSIHAPLHFGLGADSKTVRIEIAWPSGARQVIDSARVDQILKVTEPRSPPPK